MRYDLSIKTAPAVEPLTAAEAKLHLRVDHADEDALITRLITAARQYVENLCSRTLIDTVYYLHLDEFPDVIEFPRAPLDSVVALTYYDTAGSNQTLTATTDYVVNEEAVPPRCFPAYGKSWPATYAIEQAVRVEFKAGYGTAGSDVPEAIRQALLMLIGHWYEHRESVTVGVVSSVLKDAVDALLSSYRIHTEI